MDNQKLKQSIAKGHLPYNFDFWGDLIAGSSLFSLLITGVLLIVLKETDSPIFELASSRWKLIAIISAALVALLYWKDQQFTAIKNSYKKSTNFNKVRECLQSLGWEYSSSSDIITIELKGFSGRLIDTLIVPEKSKILFNFRYSRPGGVNPRFVILFGLRTYYKWKFETRLKTFMKVQVS